VFDGSKLKDTWTPEAFNYLKQINLDQLTDKMKTLRHDLALDSDLKSS